MAARYPLVLPFHEIKSLTVSPVENSIESGIMSLKSIPPFMTMAFPLGHPINYLLCVESFIPPEKENKYSKICDTGHPGVTLPEASHRT